MRISENPYELALKPSFLKGVKKNFRRGVFSGRNFGLNQSVGRTPESGKTGNLQVQKRVLYVDFRAD